MGEEAIAPPPPIGHATAVVYSHIVMHFPQMNIINVT